MKAVILKKKGKLGNLEVTDLPKPKIGPKDVLIKIKYAAVNYADILEVQGLYNWVEKLPFILGLESSGVVEEIGPEVTKFKVGDHVVVCSKSGNYAEYIAKDENWLLLAPKNMRFEEAAILCGAWATAYTALFEMGRVRAGELALIQSAAGGVGMAALKMAKVAGLKVYGTASTPEKRKQIEAVGARSLSYDNFDKILTDLGGADFILESVGGDVHKRSLKILAPMGRIVSIGASSIKVNKLNLLSWYKAFQDIPRINRKSLYHSKGYLTLHMGYLFEYNRDKIEPVWYRMLDFMEKNKLRPKVLPEQIYPMSKVNEAHALINNRKNIGKVLLDPRL